MLTTLRHWLNRLPISNPIQRVQARLFQKMLLIVFGGCIVGLLLSTITTRGIPALTTLIAYPSIMICVGGALVLLRRGKFAASVLLTAVAIIAAIGFSLFIGGLRNDGMALVALTVPITICGLLLGRRGLLIAVGLALGTVIIIAVLTPLFPTLIGSRPTGERPISVTLSTFVMVICILSLCLDRFGTSLHDALQAALSREHDLARLSASLEQTVAERTAELRQALVAVENREAQLNQTLAELRTSEATIRDLSAPVVPVLPGVLVAPLVGTLDSARAEALADNLLSMVAREHARHVIFDITGVPLVDTHVAQVLIRAAEAVHLLGAQVMLVGVRPEVAQTMVALNLDMGPIGSFADLQEAVGTLLRTRQQTLSVK